MGRIFRASPELPTDNNHLQIVDFGCGALAYEFGVLLALQSSAMQRVGMDVSVSLFEPHSAMLRVGMHIWRRLLDLTGHDARIDVGGATSTVRVGSATIRLARISQFPTIHPQPDAQRWLVAMHACYADSKCSIKRDLSHFQETLRPHVGLFTFHHAAEDGIRQISPFDGPGEPQSIMPLELTGQLPRTNRRGAQLAQRLGLRDDPRLTRPTEWDPDRGPRDNRALLYRSG